MSHYDETSVSVYLYLCMSFLLLLSTLNLQHQLVHIYLRRKNFGNILMFLENDVRNQGSRFQSGTTRSSEMAYQRALLTYSRTIFDLILSRITFNLGRNMYEIYYSPPYLRS